MLSLRTSFRNECADLLTLPIRTAVQHVGSFSEA